MEEKTDPGGGNAGLFDITGDAFAQKVKRVREIATYLDELKDPAARGPEFWRLGVALREMLDVGEDFHRVVTIIVQDYQAEEEITLP